MNREAYEAWLQQGEFMDGAHLMDFGRKVWDESRKQSLTEAFDLIGKLHATDRAPESTRFFYDSIISAAQDAIRSLMESK